MEEPAKTERDLGGWSIALGFTAFLLSAWTLAWLLHKDRSDEVGEFAYWVSLKLLLWLLPAVVALKLQSVRLAGALVGPSLPKTLAWGLIVGVALAFVGFAGRSFAPPYKPILTVLNAAVAAPIVEEVAFRGVVLRGLMRPLGFYAANTLTAALFLAAHAPGWWFQGKLVDMLTRPIGGALSIFVLGWLFGLVAHRSRSLGAPILAHALNNWAA